MTAIACGPRPSSTARHQCSSVVTILPVTSENCSAWWQRPIRWSSCWRSASSSSPSAHRISRWSVGQIGASCPRPSAAPGRAAPETSSAGSAARSSGPRCRRRVGTRARARHRHPRSTAGARAASAGRKRVGSHDRRAPPAERRHGSVPDQRGTVRIGAGAVCARAPRDAPRVDDARGPPRWQPITRTSGMALAHGGEDLRYRVAAPYLELPARPRPGPGRRAGCSARRVARRPGGPALCSPRAPRSRHAGPRPPAGRTSRPAARTAIARSEPSTATRTSRGSAPAPGDEEAGQHASP